MQPREAILAEVVRRIQTLPGWDARLLDSKEIETNSPRLAVAWWTKDTLAGRWTDWEQSRTLSVTVSVTVHAEQAVADSKSNVLQMLNQATEEIEQALFGDPGFAVEGVDVRDETLVEWSLEDPDGTNVASADLRFDIGYMHSRGAS